MAQLMNPLPLGLVTLRRFEARDLEDLAVLCGDEMIVRYLYWGVRTREETRDMLEARLHRPLEIVDENVLPIAVALSDNDQLIGDFMLRWVENEHRQGEMGGLLLREFHGLGIAAGVYRAILAIGFDTYGLQRIVGRCDGRNAASVRSLEKAGLHQEAHLVENEFVKGEWTDEVVMAIRRGQWPGETDG